MYARWGVEAPSHDAHGTIEEIRERMERVKASKWYMEGNELVAETDHGPVRQRISTDYILVGVDKNNLPVLRKVI